MNNIILDPQSLYTSTTQIDYETLPQTSYKAKCTVSDGSSSQSKSFNIVIQNVNEAPTFTTPSFTLTADEGPVKTFTVHVETISGMFKEHDNSIFVHFCCIICVICNDI